VTDADQEKAAMQIQNACNMHGKKKQKKAKDPNRDQSEQTGKLAEEAQQRQPVSPESDDNHTKGGKDGTAKAKGRIEDASQSDGRKLPGNKETEGSRKGMEEGNKRYHHRENAGGSEGRCEI